MARNFFRIQHSSHTLEEMQSYVSEDGGEDGGTEGICATLSVSDLKNCCAFFPSPEAEVVILNGQKVADIYDGVRMYPTAIVARMSYDEFTAKMDDGSIYDYETF